MSVFESFIVGLCIASLLTAGLVAFWYRPDRTPKAQPVFGLEQVEYEQQLHARDMTIFDLRRKLERAHLLIDPLRAELEQRSSERLAVVLQLEVERKKHREDKRRLNWNRVRVQNLKKSPRSNVIEFPTKRAGAA